MNAAFRNDIANNKIGHAYLVFSPDMRQGLDEAREFIASVLKADEVAVRLINEGAYADVTEYPKGVKDNPKAQVTVADTDDLTALVIKRPSRGERGFFIISNAETMSQQCQNKLLKTLEEPPGGVTIILLSAASGAMLPTVVSRCRVIELSYDGGALPKEKEGLILPMTEILTGLSSSKAVLSAVYGLTKYKDRLADAVLVIRLLLRDALVYKTGLKSRMFLKAYEDAVSSVSQAYSRAAAENALPFLDRTDKRLRLYANPLSVIDELCFTLAEYRVKYRKQV